MLDASGWSFLTTILVFLAATAVIGGGGVRLVLVVDMLADRTRIGEAMAGAILLGATTSLSGSVLSVAAALQDQPELAVGNALGGIAVQTLFLALADIFHRQANLEHAAASVENMMQGALLVCLMTIILLGAWSPSITLWSIHPATPLLLAGYVYGQRVVQASREQPMWRPIATRETRTDEPEASSDRYSMARLWTEFALLALAMGTAGFFMEGAATQLAKYTGVAQSNIGLVLTSTCTSLPELVTVVASVRRGALTLAVGGIIGGNAFDTLFTAASDIAYRPGSIYHTLTPDLLFWGGLSTLMTGVLLMGLLRREKHGLGGIGFESVTVVMLYLLGISVLFVS